MSRVLVINTGGTIGMVRSEPGYVPNTEVFHDNLNNMPELKEDGI